MTSLLLPHVLLIALCFVLRCSFSSSGILHVSAVDRRDAENASHITISNDKSRLTASEISGMLLLSEMFAAEDGEQEQLICAKQSLQAYATVVRNTLAGPQALAKLSEQEREAVAAALEAVDKWLKSKGAATEDDGDSQQHSSSSSSSSATPSLCAGDFQSQQTILEAVCQPSLKKLFSMDFASASASDASAAAAANPDFQQQLGVAISQMQQETQAKRNKGEASAE